MSDKPVTCLLCGEPMPPGEEVFKYHGYSGPCPKPPLPKPASNDITIPRAQHDALMAAAKVFDKYKVDLVIGWTGTDPRRLEIERALAALRAAGIQTEEE